eukprot:CAMPEP_0197026780 /NCGR_PEP_ID=MMETSP1384-20130603/6803_1 /TAXON_ID=29189 /ORGANISM="Ammonia sp." /LENGTH=249 /DNA_ID=CAMNT_0042455511 /DNA_START=272 /DNA_END=1018 /DNA_ORIENTATION=-
MVNLPIAPSWKPDFRVVVSFSTLPHHMPDLNETIQSLLHQSLKPDKIYLNIPHKSARTGKPYEIPSSLTDLTNRYASLFQIIQSKTDYGPLTKLYPTLETEQDADTLIITVDDDKVYPRHLVKTIAWYSQHHPFVAWGDCGWGFQRIPAWMNDIGVVPVYVPWMNRFKGGTKVEVLQAVCGNGYRRSFFKNLSILGNPPKGCFTTDDLWISGYLKFHAKVPRVLMKENVEPRHTQWKVKQVQTKTDLSW